MYTRNVLRVRIASTNKYITRTFRNTAVEVLVTQFNRAFPERNHSGFHANLRGKRPRMIVINHWDEILMLSSLYSPLSIVHR